MRKNYNTINLSISNGLNDKKVGTAGDYIMLLDAPSSANVRIKINDQNSDSIPLKPYHAIEARGTEVIYVSSNEIFGETIKLIQAKTSNEFKMITPASDIKIEQIGSFSDLAVSQIKFIPNGYAMQFDIPQNSYSQINKNGLTAIKFTTNQTIGIELNENGIKYPMKEDNEIFLTNIDTVKFHNENATTANLKILEMGTHNAIMEDYLISGYVDTNYIIGV